MKSFIKLLSLLSLFLSTTAAASAEHLKVIPTDCSDKFLATHFHQVLPCYLAKPDKYYKWQIISEQSSKQGHSPSAMNINVINVEMDALRWTIAEQSQVNHPVWRHRLTIYQPEKLRSETALLYINGGTTHPVESGKSKSNDDLLFAKIAANTGSVVIDLKDIPNQFLTFGKGKPLKEDALIAYTWHQFLKDPKKNFNWPLRLPMVKASMRAMDTAQAILAQKKSTINKFVLSGGSKRGWTVWLTAAMDKRASGVIPMVIDIPNLQANMNHHKQVYGKWAPAVKDYFDLMETLNTRPLAQLMEIVDPYNYRKQLTMPKYIINATGDDFFLPDASRFYFNDLAGPKWLRFLPNLRHYIVQMDRELVSNTVESFYGALISNKVLPEIKADFIDGRIKLHSSIKPEKVWLWTAHNSRARDFRIASPTPPDAPFNSVPVKFNCEKECNLSIPVTQPERGWNASFVELIYPNPPYRDLSFTSRVFITPDVYPDFEKSGQP